MRETPIVIDATGGEVFFERLKTLLRTSGCKYIYSHSQLGPDVRAIYISSQLAESANKNPQFTVNFTLEGICIQLSHPKLLCFKERDNFPGPIEDCWVEEPLKVALNSTETSECAQLNQFVELNREKFSVIPEQFMQACNIVNSPYVFDFLNECFAAAYLAAEIQKLATHRFVPERRPIVIKKCQIKFQS